MDSQNNIENITIRQVGDDTVNVTFTRFDNTNDLNDVIITKVKRVFIMTQQQKQIQEQLNKLRAQSFTYFFDGRFLSRQKTASLHLLAVLMKHFLKWIVPF